MNKSLINEINNFKIVNGLSIYCNQNDIYLLKNGRTVSFINYYTYGNRIYIEYIQTPNPNNRGQKYAEKLLAIFLWCAKRAGYQKADAISMFLKSTNRPLSTATAKNGSVRPLSARLFNKLGFIIYVKNQANGSENRRLNMRGNIPGINAVIRELR